jgi:arylsulfatase A-like enzyme
MKNRPNIVVVVSDTLRAASVGCYGNSKIHTPNIDAFAKRSIRFTRAYPESLPTIPVRRALHTGRRAYPFRNYQPVKWDIVYLPGWQAIDNGEDTLAENLAAAGYHTGFATDTLPYFAPGFNFTRGFWQWEYIRGQLQDRWKSPYAVSEEKLARYGNADELKKEIHQQIPMYLANTSHVRSEQDTSTAHTFQSGMKFLEDNRNGQPFYLLLDCFAPHEPWEAPEKYYLMYGNPDYSGRRIVHCKYAPADKSGYTPEEIIYIKAQYNGLVSLVDTWFGKFIDRLDQLGLAENTVVMFVSDHGTNFCDNPRNIIGKPSHAMYPGVMHLPFLFRLPNEAGAGSVRNDLVYNIDLTGTVYALAGIKSADGIDGQSLLPLINGTEDWKTREYLTCRYANYLCYIDDHTWAMGDIDGNPRELFDLESDPDCQVNIREKDGEKRWKQAWDRLIYDAQGDMPDYRNMNRTDAIGQKPAR